MRHYVRHELIFIIVLNQTYPANVDMLTELKQNIASDTILDQDS